MADGNFPQDIFTRNDGDVSAKLYDGTNTLDFAVHGASVASYGLLAHGSDGTNNYRLLTDNTGALQVDVLSGAGGTTDDDDDSIAAGQTLNTGVSILYAYNGTEHERLQSDGSGSLKTNLTAALPTGANSIGTVGLNAGANSIGSVDINAGQSVALNTGTNSIGSVDINAGQTVGLDTGTNSIGFISTITNFEATEDAAYKTTGVQLYGKYEATPTTVGDGDAVGILTDANGAVQIVQKAGTTLNVAIAEDAAADNIHSYEQETAVAAGGTSTHIYTVSGGKTLLLKSIACYASGQGRALIETGPSGSEVAKAVIFWSAAKRGEQITFPAPIEVVATDTVKITMQNRESSAQDMYSFINGVEV